jgi:type 1 glutamine amidotransferase
MRTEEWYRFNSWTSWSTKPGFKILSTRDTVAGEPASTASTWIREWSNFRSFYTGMGHAGVVFEDANFKKMITRGILWAVRREALIK